jgi:hypothetical protein
VEAGEKERPTPRAIIYVTKEFKLKVEKEYH